MTNYFPPLILMGLIFISSSIPMDGQSEHLKFLMKLKPTVQNLLHIPLFGLFAYLWLRAFTRHGFSKTKTFVPGRYGSLTDMLLNIVGIITGAVIYLHRAESKQ
ncbi:MAG: hypothetical protein LWW97_08935 [Deltaproteobacteria bacterium]|nr:hypothetical protein [Deltaproteobacteria bacterium]